jgi:putative heme-binding domain-containing protein
LLSREETTNQLVLAVETGRLTANQFDARRRQQLREHPSSAIRERAKLLFSAASDPSRKQVLDAYAKVAELPADAVRGKAVFEKRCANCHKLGGAGHEVGPDLAALTDKSLPSLLVAVLDPNRAVEDKFLDFTATTADGRVVNGLLWSESGAGVTLRAAEGKEISLARAEIEELRSTGKSLMPEGLERDVSQQEMADVLSFVRQLEPPAKKFSGNSPAIVEANREGVLHLPATACHIYGPTLVFEQLYGNLGYWQSESDRAAWTVDAPREGVYRVSLVYACENGSAGGEIAVVANGQRLRLKTRGTGTWDDYQRIEIGELQLPAGQSEVAAQSVGQPASALLDLREIVLTPVR